MEKEKSKIRSIKAPISALVTGRFLLSKSWEKNWPFIIYLSILALVMIASSHSADRKVHEIEKLSRQMKELNSEYIETKSLLMQESMESKVVEKAAKIGLTPSDNPPVKISINTELE